MEMEMYLYRENVYACAFRYVILYVSFYTHTSPLNIHASSMVR